MSLTPLPWSIPVIGGNHLHISLGSTATLIRRDPNDTSTDVDMNAAPQVAAAPLVERPRVGRPHRGDRAKVKASRRARRAAR